MKDQNVMHNFINFKNYFLKLSNTKRTSIKFAFLFLIFLLFFLIVLFYSSSSLSLLIPNGTNATKIWLTRTQILFKNVIAGLAIGLSNYLIQMYTRNKLADTSVLGINVFQQITVAIFILLAPLFFLDLKDSYIFGFIFLGVGILSGLLFYLISLKTNLGSKRIVIYGVLLNIFVSSFSYLILSSNAINLDVIKSRVIDYIRVSFGGIQIDSNDFSGIFFSAILLLICLIWALALKYKIIAQSTTLSKVNTLGVHNSLTKINLIILVSITGSIIFNMVGFIAFIGVSVSYITASLFKGFNNNIFGSMLIASIILLFSQIIQTSLSHVGSIPTTSIIGIISFPIFITFMLFKR